MKKRILLERGLFGWLILFSTALTAQTAIVLHDSTDLAKFINLSQYIQAYEGGYSDSLQVAGMANGPWRLIKTETLPTFRKGLKFSRWIRFRLQNTNPDDTLKLFYYGGYDLLTNGYSFDNGSLVSVFRTGWLRNTPLPAWAWSGDNFALPIIIPPNTERTFWINNIYYYAPIRQFVDAVRLLVPTDYDSFKAVRTWHNRWVILFIGFFLSVCIILSINGLFQVIVTKDITYLGWAIYLGCMFLFFLRSFEYYTNIRIISRIFPAYFGRSLGLIQNGAQIGYFIFFDAFLKVKQYSPALHRAIRMFTLVLVIFFAYSLTVFFEPLLDINPVRELLNNGMDGCMFLFVMTILVITARKKIPLSRFLIIGSGCLYVGLAITFYYNRFSDEMSIEYPWELPSFYFGVGILTEVFLFSLALSFRSRLIENQKNQLQRDYTLNLELELDKRTQEVQQQNQLAEEMRVQQLMSEFDKKLTETEMTALRSQMNPHFIFNCLNSIQYFTAQNDAEKASDYLTKFSRLIRLVLENSRSEKVTLANELETLRLYIDMEAMRFQQKVRYEITVDDDIDTDSVQIPPLLLQPFVENAIWHGLMHKEAGGTVTVTVEQPQTNRLHVDITDDGVGRAKAAEFKSKSATRNKSFGMKLTTERIDLINQLYNAQTSVEIIDLTDASGQATGTNVCIDITI